MRGDEDILAEDSLYLVEVDNLKGVPIFSASGRKVGALDSAVVSKYTGDIQYVVINCSSLLGLRRKRYVLPRSALQADAERGGFSVDLTRHAKGPVIAPEPVPATPAVPTPSPVEVVEAPVPPPAVVREDSAEPFRVRRIPPVVRLDPARPE